MSRTLPMAAALLALPHLLAMASARHPPVVPAAAVQAKHTVSCAAMRPVNTRTREVRL